MRIVICLTLVSAISARAALSRLDALGMIESGNNDAAIGQAGEVSRYQIQPRIWRVYSDSRDYRNRDVARVVASRHLTELERIFCQCAGRTPTEFDIYVLWNAGPTYYRSIGWTRNRVHPIVAERATRYANLRSWEGPPTSRVAANVANASSSTAAASATAQPASPDRWSRTNAFLLALPDRTESLTDVPHRVFALEGAP